MEQTGKPFSKEALIDQLIERDILITPEQARKLTDHDMQLLTKMLHNPQAIEMYLDGLNTGPIDTPYVKIEASPQSPEVTGVTIAPRAHESPSPETKKTPQPAADSGVTILKHYAKKPKKRTYNDFVQYFNTRFLSMEKYLRGRSEMAGVMSIERTKQYSKAGDKGKVAIIGIVLDKRETKNGHIVLELEDRSGSVTVLCTQSKTEVHELAKDLSFDEIVGVTGSIREGTIFADTLLLPSIPVANELKKAPDDAYMVCISDTEFGSKDFFEESFGTFLKWIRGEVGTPEAQAIAKKVKYIFVAGDIVAGVGVYPNQEKDLGIVDIYDQYRMADEWLCRIPEHIHLFFIPGNHDIGRLSEPQPALGKDVLPRLHERPNTYFLSNPSVVRIHQTKTFPGFTCQLYHGGSFIYYGNNVMRLFQEGGMSNPGAVMQYLLQRRHLAPTHTATLYVPDGEEDHLIMDEIPDFIITGHLHTTQHKTWNGITMLSCSCWVPITEFQMKQGLKIDPGKFMLINLQTRHVQALKPEDVL